MNLHHLAVFHAVAETGSVNAAAERLHVSQPAVSRELRAFEARLKVQLFDRLPRGMRLTEAGHALHGYSARLFAVEAAAQAAMLDISTVRGGSLAIGASNTIGTYLMPTLLASFNQRHADVQLSLEIGNTMQIAQAVADAQLTIGFLEGPVAKENLLVRTFSRDRIIAVVAADHALATRKKLTPRELSAAPSILRERGSGTREIVEAAFSQRHLALRCTLEIGSSEAVKRAALAGAGVAWLSELCVHDELAQRTLVKLDSSLTLKRELSFVCLKDRTLSPAATAFLKLLEISAV